MTEAWRETKSPLYAQRIEETISWLLREMVVDTGGFASSLDADSEGEEGKFYVWSLAEIEAALGAEDARLFAEIYDVTAAGNFEGHNILNRLGAIALRDADTEARLASLRAKLLAHRATRVRPGFDDKVLADWNGLTIAALANAAQAFDREDWLAAAARGFAFVRERMTAAGRLLHAWRAGEAKAPATASDYANMIRAALALANATGKRDYIVQAQDWAAVLDTHYWSDELSGYYFAADDTGDLIVRPFSGQDEATPNANGVMVSNLTALYAVDRRRALSRPRRGDPARLRRGHERERAGPCRIAGRGDRRRRAGADRADRAGRRRCRASCAARWLRCRCRMSWCRRSGQGSRYRTRRRRTARPRSTASRPPMSASARNALCR